MKIYHIASMILASYMAWSIHAQTLQEKDSSQFVLQGTTFQQYEGDSLPTTLASPYTLTVYPIGVSEQTYSSVSNSILTVNTMDSVLDTVQYTFPSSVNISATTGFTWEIKIKVDNYSGNVTLPVSSAICFTVGGANSGFNLGFTSKEIILQTNSSSYCMFDVPMNTQFQTVRVAKTNNIVSLYLNGNLLTNTVAYGTNMGYFFGDVSQSASSKYEIDYIRMDNTGAYASAVPELSVAGYFSATLFLVVSATFVIEVSRRIKFVLLSDK